MPTNFQRPTPVEILLRVKADIEAEIAGASARLRHTTEVGLAKAITGVSHALHGHLAWVASQILPSADMSEGFLLRFGDAFGTDRKAALAATRTIEVDGSGGDLDEDTQWIRVADGYVWEVDADHVAVSTPTEVQITASEASVAALGGAAGNLEPGEVIQLVSPISGIVGTATVVADVATDVDGSDLETLTAYLVRVLARLRNPPKGGAPGDFETWALEVPGVTRAWEYVGIDGEGNPGIGQVALTFMRDGDADPIPDGDAVQAVQDYIDARFFGERVTVFAPTAVAFDYTVQLTPNTLAVQNAVQDVNGDEATGEVPDMLRRDAIPGGTIRLSRLREAISAATGETDHELVSPTEDVEFEFGQIAVPGTRVFQAP